MPNTAEIRDFFNSKAPYYTKFDFDNVGMLVGFCGAEITKVLVALDITDEVIEEAVDMGAELIVSHHPLMFEGLKRITDEDDKGKKVIRMLTSGISAICLHTNLDTADGGVNDVLMNKLGAKVTGLISPHGTHPDGRPFGVSRIGEMNEETDFFDFLSKVKCVLASNGIRYYYAGKKVRVLGCCGGSGGSDIEKAFNAGCDTFVTADIKYDHFLWAKEHGLNLIDADHFCTENVVVPVLAEMLKREYPKLEVSVSNIHSQTAQFF